MGQEEVKEWLQKNRERGDDSYYSIAEIGKCMGNMRQVYPHVNKLYAYGFLDIEIVSWIPLRRKFRIKKEYIRIGVPNSPIMEKKQKPHCTIDV